MANIGKNHYFRDMLFSRFFKQPKPNKFGYTPLYYDEQKEKRDQRIKMIEKEMGVNQAQKEFDQESFRERFSSKVGASRSAKQKTKFGMPGVKISGKNSTRILVLIILAGVILYWQLKN